MARVFVSSSSTGLRSSPGKELLAKGHDMVLHARAAGRAEHIRRKIASSIVVGDIGTVGGALDLADQVEALGPVDAVATGCPVPP